MTTRERYEWAWKLRRSDVQTSQETARLLAADADAAGDLLGRAQAELVLAVHAGYAGRLQDCLETASTSLKIFERFGDFTSQIRAHNVIGYVHLVRNELAKALETLLQGLLLSRDHFDPDMQIYFLYNIGEIYKNTFQLHGKALGYLEEALDLALRTEPCHPLLAGLHASIALCLQKGGEGGRMETHVGQALQIAAQTDDRQTLSVCYHMLALTRFEEGNFSESRRYLDLEYGLIEPNRDPYALISVQLADAQLLAAQGLHQDAIDLSQSALASVESLRYDALTYHFLKILAESHWAMGQFESAARYYRQYTEAYQRSLTLEVENRLSLMSTEIRFQEQTRALQAQMRETHMVALTDLVSGVAHEINTPLGNAITLASYLSTSLSERDDQSRDEKSQALGLLRESLRKTASIVDQFKKIATNYHDLDLTTISLRTLLGELEVLARPLNRDGEIIHRFDCPEGLFLESYKSIVVHTLLQLVENAGQHAFAPGPAPAGAEPWTVSILAFDSPHDPSVVIAVTDNGAGIPPENLERVFNPFFTTKKAQGGIGLGLHIVYNLVTQVLRGTIEVQSTPDRGTTFTLRLPKRMPR